MNQKKLPINFIVPEEALLNLKRGGISRCFLSDQTNIVIQDSDEVQVKLTFTPDGVYMDSVFPKVGNGVQVLSTIALVVLGYWFQIPFNVILGILAGQALAFFYYQPKINKLRDQIELALTA